MKPEKILDLSYSKKGLLNNGGQAPINLTCPYVYHKVFNISKHGKISSIRMEDSVRLIALSRNFV